MIKILVRHICVDKTIANIETYVRIYSSEVVRLDVLFNNAGVSQPPVESISKQGHELQIAVNLLGPFLFTRLLLPLLEATASAATTTTSSSSSSSGVIWTSSRGLERQSMASSLQYRSSLDLHLNRLSLLSMGLLEPTSLI